MRQLSFWFLALLFAVGCGDAGDGDDSKIGSSSDAGGDSSWGGTGGADAGTGTAGATDAGATGGGAGSDGGSGGSGGGEGTGDESGGDDSDSAECTDFSMSLVEGVVLPPAVVRLAIRLQCDGEPVPDKTEEDFSIAEDGTAVSSFESDFMIVPTVSALRLATVMLIDVSGSIVSSGSIATLQTAALSFIERIGDDQEVAIYLFDGRPDLQLLQPLTSDREFLTYAVNSLSDYEVVDTSTNLNGAIISGINIMGSLAAEDEDTLIDTSMVVFTDGADMASYYSNEAAVEAVESTTHAFYTVGLGSDLDEEHMGAVGRDGYFSSTDLTGLEAAFDEVAERISNAARSVYIMAYCSPRRSGEHEVQLKLNDADASITLLFNADGFGAGCSSTDFLPPEFLDIDEDGFRPYDGDCDDEDGTVFPGAVTEAFDGECMHDEDGDGFGDRTPPAGFDAGTDCDDRDETDYPGAVMEADSDQCMIDIDGDGYGGTVVTSSWGSCTIDDVCYAGYEYEEYECSAYFGGTWSDIGCDDVYVSGTDCNDDNNSEYPGAVEEATSEECMRDVDGDGYGERSPTSRYDAGTDCDDRDGSDFPGAVEEAGPDECMKDEDGDGWGENLRPSAAYAGSCRMGEDGSGTCYSGVGEASCVYEFGGTWSDDVCGVYVSGGDCDDENPYVYPGIVSEAAADECMVDLDSDGYGDSTVSFPYDAGSDCDDTDPSSTYTFTDSDCDGVPEGGSDDGSDDTASEEAEESGVFCFVDDFGGTCYPRCYELSVAECDEYGGTWFTDEDTCESIVDCPDDDDTGADGDTAR